MNRTRWTMLALLLIAGCVGTVSDDGKATPAPGPGPGPGPGPDPGPTPSDEVVARPKVTLPPLTPKLLPFEVRLRRIAAAVGLPVDDAVFDVARGQRLALGGHDFVNGVAPDLQWDSQRIAGWIAVMLPVCRDGRVRTRLGAWNQGGIEKFAEGAFGRAATPDDLADLSAALALSGDAGWVATCLSLVSSAEVLLR